MEFSFFYPEGAEIIPMTMMICKMNPQHGLIDRLIEKPECTKCEGGKGRVESVSGYLKEGERYSVVKSFVTKTAIDSYTGTAKDGSLYSLVAVSATVTSEDSNSDSDKIPIIVLVTVTVPAPRSLRIRKTTFAITTKNTLFPTITNLNTIGAGTGPQRRTISR